MTSCMFDVTMPRGQWRRPITHQSSSKQSQQRPATSRQHPLTLTTTCSLLFHSSCRRRSAAVLRHRRLGSRQSGEHHLLTTVCDVTSSSSHTNANADTRFHPDSGIKVNKKNLLEVKVSGRPETRDRTPQFVQRPSKN